MIISNMMLSQTAEYALRVMVLLAQRDGRPATSSQIASATRVPPGYLSKVLQELSRNGLVRSRRGLHGGSVLARTPESISIYDIVNAMDGVPRIHTCPANLPEHVTELCRLHRKLDDAVASVETLFRDTTLRSLMAEPGGTP